MGDNEKKKSKKKPKFTAKTADKHILYEASVQAVEPNMVFVNSVYRKKRRRRPHLLREDFCGTANLACAWVRSSSKNEAWGIDLDGPTLDWGRKRHVAQLEEKAKRLHLIQDDVLAAKAPKVDIVVAFNFSYWIFKERKTLLKYFKGVRRGLKDDGMVVLD
ncbi:MAG: class I SAM-dependent methyltransferase, partial [Verrucomicrobiota bacterium]